MMRCLLLLLIFTSCAVHKKTDLNVTEGDVRKIISTLADDRFQGRAVFTQGIEDAADFIADEFEKAGLQAFESGGGKGFRQSFEVIQIKPAHCNIWMDGKSLTAQEWIVISDQAGLNWNVDPTVVIKSIEKGDDFRQAYHEISKGNENTLVVVDESFAKEFDYLKQYAGKSRLVLEEGKIKKNSVVFVLGKEKPKSFRVNYSGTIEKKELTNVVGILPGKSKPDEYVVFSGHYDHLGILEAVGQDSIANGADDDASGVTAVISLAKIFSKSGDNQRSLVFVAFTAEESGGYGSQYFSQQLDPAKVVAMVNIEMIGKDSKFGPNSMYITGFEKSNLGSILQQNVKNTGFSFYPDPYPTQQLFYRSDNATLAALGVPAHTASTVQIDKDHFYHTVHDEVKTLDIKNITSSIKAIALGVRSIISGKDTPTRIEPLQN